MSEKEKMIAGLKYDLTNPKLVLERARANRICTKYNKKAFHEINMRSRLLRKLINTEANFWIKPPFFCDYGYNIFIGSDVMLNYNCVILDVCPVVIGEHTLIGPGTHIYTACHSLDAQERRADREFGKAVHIGKNVWIGGNCSILPGVTIGDNTVIGAGSVVTKDIPANVIAVGNPCMIINHNLAK
ncbi:MAG: sugar O-acetyltransferase [Erysipelotrichia bacterium]|nr:sugar O-acetyltransferase [Erysipelotrichia bacterium]NCC54425.1 sugar O-acetyltransferase [Erysipelotrichia bacterium]